MGNQSRAVFGLGQILATPRALEAIEDSDQLPSDFLDRHGQGDWGDVCDEDGRLNDRALVEGDRLLSVYSTEKGVKLWIITEASDDGGHRVATTILLPDEY